jgi:hypothetical protein
MKMGIERNRFTNFILETHKENPNLYQTPCPTDKI